MKPERMLRKLIRCFSSSRQFEQIQVAKKERERMIKKIYEPIAAENDFRKRLEMMYSGKLWLKHAELEIRPKKISHQVIKGLKDLDDYIAQRHVDYLRNDDLWFLFKVALTHHSTAIEGNLLSLEQTRIVLGGDVGDPLSSLIEIEEIHRDLQIEKILGESVSKDDLNEVINHGQAMEFMRENILMKRKSIDEEDIVSINQMVCPSVSLIRHCAKDVPEDTKYRKLPVYVRGSSTVQPYPHEVPSIMKELLHIHNEKSRLLHPVISVCQFHMNFLWVHPFLDGNGRTARLLSNILLLNSGYPGVIIPISDRSEYMSFFEPERQHNNTNYFLFMICKIKETLCDIS